MLPRKYSNLNPQQLGALGEGLAQAAFVISGFEVYLTHYDDRGVDLAVWSPRGRSYKAQVKATGPTVQPFIYERRFKATEDFLFVAIRLTDGLEPALYLAKGSEWLNPNGCIRHNASGGQAGPYYEFSFAPQYEAHRAQFLFGPYADTL